LKIFILFIFGLLYSLLFPPYFFAPLGFLIFPFICILIEKNKNKLKKIEFFNYSFIFFFGFLLSFLFWMHNPFFVFNETKYLFFLFLLLIVLLSFIFSLTFTLIVSYNNIISPLFLVPLVFVIYEYLISIMFSGFPWITISLIFSNSDFFSFIIRNFGTLISSYIVIQIFCLPFIFFTTQPNKIKNLYYFIFISLPLLIILTFNTVSTDKKNNVNRKISLEIFQLNQNITTKKRDLDLRLNEIIKQISKSNAEILIFGENNFPYILSQKEIKLLQSLLKKNQKLVIGGTRIANGSYFNTLLHMNKKNFSYFDKRILVPFGEYLPLRKFLSFLEPISGQNDFSVGINDRFIKIDNNISYIPVICYEIIFYWKLINNLNYDSDFIINITNDVWFGNLLGPYQHFYLTKLRAAEFYKPVIRVSNNGISGIINENGKILLKTELNENQINEFNIQFKKNKSLYKTHYYLNIYFFIICSLLIILNIKNRNESPKI
tara:strand:+ start:2330 stop:3799 length:1470 start_codon:yes stop_codon:yes gene_type:complete